MAKNQPTVTSIIPAPGLRDPGYFPAEFDTEQWCEVTGFEGCEGKYSISSFGRVWSHVTNRVLKVSYAGRVTSYPCITLGRHRPYIHRLVAEAFLPAAPGEGYQIDHINGNPADPRLTNLRWVTPGENTLLAQRMRKTAGATARPKPHRRGTAYYCWQGHMRPAIGEPCLTCRSERDAEIFRQRASRMGEMRGWFSIFQKIPTPFHDVDVVDEKAAT